MKKETVVAVEKPAIKNPMVKAQIVEPLPVKKAPKAKKGPAKHEPQDSADSVWKLLKKPDETVTGARLVICELLSKAPGKKMKRGDLERVIAKAAKSEQAGSYILSLKRKFLVDGGWVRVE